MESHAAFGLGTQEVKRRHILPKALVVGIVAGLIGSAFRTALQRTEYFRIAWLHGVSPALAFVALVGGGALMGGLAVWLVRRFAPEAAGSGIPHLKAVVLGQTTLQWRRVLPVKFVGGLVGIGGGMALGREGPTVQMGGATGMMVSEWFKVRAGEGERKALISAGAGAGLAAAFNAPLAGVVFVLEELQGNFTQVVFVATFLASVASDVVCRVLTGEMPVFTVRDITPPSVAALPLALVLGVAAGFGGVLFNKSLLGVVGAFERLRRWPPFLVGAVAGIVAGLAAWIYPGIAGSGGTLVERALNGDIAVQWLAVFLIARFGLTMVSYGSGAAGGIFAPLLVIGALGGLAGGDIAHRWWPGVAPHPEAFTVLGMGALLTAIVRAPLTGIVLMVELTGKYDFMLPLLVSCLAAYGVAEALGNVPIYEALRLRNTKKKADGQI